MCGRCGGLDAINRISGRPGIGEQLLDKSLYYYQYQAYQRQMCLQTQDYPRSLVQLFPPTHMHSMIGRWRLIPRRWSVLVNRRNVDVLDGWVRRGGGRELLINGRVCWIRAATALSLLNRNPHSDNCCQRRDTADHYAYELGGAEAVFCEMLAQLLRAARAPRTASRLGAGARVRTRATTGT